MRYQNCIFDLYGTLVDIRTDEERPALWERLAEWYAEYGARYTPDELRQAYLDGVRREEAELARQYPGVLPEIRIERVFMGLFTGRGAAADTELAAETGRLFRELSMDYVRLYDGADRLLQRLRENGRRVYLLSNAQRIFTWPELEGLGIAELFDGIYISSDWGCKKPDSGFFHCLLRGEGIAPESAVMVGNDGHSDIAGAAALGIATVYVRSDISPDEPVPPADFALSEPDMSALADILLEKC